MQPTAVGRRHGDAAAEVRRLHASNRRDREIHASAAFARSVNVQQVNDADPEQYQHEQ